MSVERLSRLLAGDNDVAWVRDGLKLWLAAGGDLPLERCLRLPSRPAGLRRMLRDLQLVEAARHLPPGPTWTRARMLSEAIQRFEARLWPCWRSMSEPPGYATPIERRLFQARLYGALPSSERSIYRLLTQNARALSVPDAYRGGIDHREEEVSP